MRKSKQNVIDFSSLKIIVLVVQDITKRSCTSIFIILIDDNKKRDVSK